MSQLLKLIACAWADSGVSSRTRNNQNNIMIKSEKHEKWEDKGQEILPYRLKAEPGGKHLVRAKGFFQHKEGVLPDRVRETGSWKLKGRQWNVALWKGNLYFKRWDTYDLEIYIAAIIRDFWILFVKPNSITSRRPSILNSQIKRMNHSLRLGTSRIYRGLRRLLVWKY